MRKYYGSNIHFGKTYLLPIGYGLSSINPFSTAVAQAAVTTGVAQKAITEWGNL
ncbi:MAG: hypothetical protein NQ127_03445 [Candidatus Cardinium sp.]|nr:hypothetical protein [Candidatus Cardinium sp.]